MVIGRGPKLPIYKAIRATGRNGETYVAEISIERTTDYEMKLEILDIFFKDIESFFTEIDDAIGGKSQAVDPENQIVFDSEETFRRFFHPNKIQILSIISRVKPKSIYQIEKLVGRKYPAVLKDCRQLESLGFIKLNLSGGAQKQLIPELSFGYDMIKVNSLPNEYFPISEKAVRVLMEAAVG